MLLTRESVLHQCGVQAAGGGGPADGAAAAGHGEDGPRRLPQVLLVVNSPLSYTVLLSAVCRDFQFDARDGLEKMTMITLEDKVGTALCI